MIFYDFEVFKYDWLVHFINMKTKEETTIINDNEQLRSFYKKNKNEIFAGFNNVNYDQYIFKGLLLDMNPYDISRHIIEDKKPGFTYSNAFWDIRIINYDVQSDYFGLKRLEAFMGHDIRETTVDFKLQRKLTDSEIQEVVDYCKYDVKQTIEVFIRRLDQFKTKFDLITEFNRPLYDLWKTETQLSADVLGCVKQPRRDEYNLNLPSNLIIDKYKETVRWFLNPVNHKDKTYLEIEMFDTPHTLAWGGIHGAKRNYIESGNFVLVDVSSYYPSLMIEYDYLSRNVFDKEVYKEMYKERFRLRALGDPRQEVLKLVLNKTYGAMGFPSNKLYDPLMRQNVCVTGQLFLVDLIEKFEKIDGIELIQSNTDGLLLRYDTRSQLKAIKLESKKWSKRTKMNLSYEYYNKIIQKDVNNYIAVADNPKYNVYVGGYVKRQDDLDYDLPVINTAVREYLINGTPPEFTIRKERRLHEFQKIVTVSRLYDYAVHNGKRLNEHTLRVFASNDSKDGTVYKYRKLDGKSQYSKFANTSINSFIDNTNVKNKRVTRRLDKNWYIALAERRIRQFKGGGVS